MMRQQRVGNKMEDTSRYVHHQPQSPAVIKAHANLPKRSMQVEMPETTANHEMFATRSSIAWQAEEQKLVPLTTVTMYAILLRAFMHFSRHQRQHRRQQKTNFHSGLGSSVPPVIMRFCFSMYSSAILNIWMTAMMREPKAT